MCKILFKLSNFGKDKNYWWNNFIIYFYKCKKRLCINNEVFRNTSASLSVNALISSSEDTSAD